MNLKDAKVIGFFSLPSAALADANPDGYNLAMKGAPEGAGSCAHCGNGILHHVVIRTSAGGTAFIGQDCAAKVGGPSIARCVREKLTDEQIAKRDAESQLRAAAAQAAMEADKANERARAESLRDLIVPLWQMGESKADTFLGSLAHQLARGPLSRRQAFFACKALYGPRQNKANRDIWEASEERMVAI